jgi:hypothetical protein
VWRSYRGYAFNRHVLKQLGKLPIRQLQFLQILRQALKLSLTGIQRS